MHSLTAFKPAKKGGGGLVHDVKRLLGWVVKVLQVEWAVRGPFPNSYTKLFYVGAVQVLRFV